MIKAAINRLLGLAGLRLSRLRQDPPKGYYRASSSCQIPNLSTLYERLLGSRATGFFVEVGAFDGESFSNVSCLSDRGWAGLMLEPVPEFAAQAARRHAGNRSVRVIRSAIGSHAGQIQMTVAGSLSTANEDMIDNYAEIDWARDHVRNTHVIAVPVATLDHILEVEGAPNSIDVVSIDTEGFESEVLAGFSIERWNPRMIIIELADFHPDLVDRCEEDRQIARQIVSQGYEIVYKDHINTVFAQCRAA